MANAPREQKFYLDDTCVLKSDHRRIGWVERTHSDVSTHRPDPLNEYPAGIKASAGITNRDFHRFLASGIPPRGMVLVTWHHLPWQSSLESFLMRECLLLLVDRSLMRGDIVKRSPRDAMSGTVLRVQTAATLAPPRPWVKPTAPPLTRLARTVTEYGNFCTDERDLIRNVSTDDLIIPTLGPQDFILYKDWVGRVTDTEEEVAVRLKNNSVVVVENADDLTHSSPDAVCEVGDFVTTQKSNLRRGRWIYGAYDANIEPSGLVAEVHVTSAEVSWLYQCGTSPEPPQWIDRDMLDSDETRIYERRRLPPATDSNGEKSPENKRRKLELDDLSIGDRVRFADLAGAVVKYPSRVDPATNKSSSGVSRIPKTDSLGYDINVFLVVGTASEITVQWQDLSVSRVKSTELVPFLDLDGEDEVWPGEIVTTRSLEQLTEDFVKPKNVGVVQSVNAADRIAHVKWFDADIKLSIDSVEHLEGNLGQVRAQAEEVSLYEVWTVPALARRLGDFVIVLHDDCAIGLSPHQRLLNVFGEVIELGLDGRLTVRLGSSPDCRDVKVSWEMTVLVYSSDSESQSHMEEVVDDESEDSMDISATLPGSWPTVTIQVTGPDGNEVEGMVEGELEDEDWETEDDDEEGKDPMERDLSDAEPEEDALNHSMDLDGVSRTSSGMDPPDINGQITTELPFSYETMFRSGRPQAFAILDGAAPDDHYFAGGTDSMTSQRMRRIHKEHKILSTSLPAGQVYVRSWESNLDLLRILILGPLDTPYEYAPFVIDMHLDADFPAQPPKTYFHSWTDRKGPINPNLYEDGKICLSLLGTWPGEEGQSWNAANSTVLQIVVSLLGLVLVKEPFYNEAGYEVRAGTVESAIPSRQYSERTYLRSRGFIWHGLTSTLGGFSELLREIYLGEPKLLLKAIQSAEAVMWASQRPASTANSAADATMTDASSGTAADAGAKAAGEQMRISAGAVVPLKRQLVALVRIVAEHDISAANEVAQPIGLKYVPAEVDPEVPKPPNVPVELEWDEATSQWVESAG